MDVSGKIAIVTGGGRGIGRGISLALARNGADIVIADIIVKNAEGVADEVRSLGRRSLAVSLDVSDRESVEEMTAQDHGRVRRNRHTRQQRRSHRCAGLGEP